MPSLGIIDNLASPRLNHTAENLRKFGPSHSIFREDLCIMTTNVFNNPERFARLFVYKRIFCSGGNLIAELVDKITSMDNIFRHIKLPSRCLVQVFPCFFKLLRKMLPGLKYLGVNTKGGYARDSYVLVSGLLHKSVMTGYNGLDGRKGNNIGMISYPGTSGMRWILIHILAQNIAHKMQEKLLRAREKTLPDARPYIKEMIISYFLLIIAPYHSVIFLFHIEYINRYASFRRT